MIISWLLKYLLNMLDNDEPLNMDEMNEGDKLLVPQQRIESVRLFGVILIDRVGHDGMRQILVSHLYM